MSPDVSKHIKLANAMNRFEQALLEFDQKGEFKKASRTHRMRIRVDIALDRFRETLECHFHEEHPESVESNNPYRKQGLTLVEIFGRRRDRYE